MVSVFWKRRSLAICIMFEPNTCLNLEYRSCIKLHFNYEPDVQTSGGMHQTNMVITLTVCKELGKELKITSTIKPPSFLIDLMGFVYYRQLCQMGFQSTPNTLSPLGTFQECVLAGAFCSNFFVRLHTERSTFYRLSALVLKRTQDS